MQIIAQIKVKVSFLFSCDKHYLILHIFFPNVSFNHYVNGVPGGVFIYTSFILNGVDDDDDDDDDSVGSEFK